MEKVKLNNQIVSMRKYIKQAKVHVINKLVKQIKLLQNRNGSETQIQKAKRKAERFLEAVALVKKIKPDDVSKLALSKAKDWKDVLQQKNSALYDRCIAMLANYGAVQKEVEAFYNANTELILKISDYITQWEEKNKLSKDSPKNNKMSLKRNIQKANLKDESSKNNKFKTVVKAKTKSDAEKTDKAFKMFHEDKKTHSEAEDSDNNVNDEEKTAIILKSDNYKNLIGNTKATEDLPNDESNSMEAEELDDDNEESESDEHGEEEKIFDNSLNNEKETKDSSDEEINKMHKPVSKSNLNFSISNHPKNKLKTIALLNLNELDGLDEIPVSSVGNDEYDQKKSSEDEINETFQNKNTDPFFLGYNKEDPNAEKSDDSNDSDANIRIKDSTHSFNHRTETAKNSFLYRKGYQFSPKKFSQKSSYDQKNLSRSFKNVKNCDKSFKSDNISAKNYHNKFQEKNVNKNKKDYKLKNKLYPLTDTYEKKKFESASKGSGGKDNMFLRNKVPYKKGNASEHLHPSWEAKRKQKELLSTSFQGKRIVFND